MDSRSLSDIGVDGGSPHDEGRSLQITDGPPDPGLNQPQHAPPVLSLDQIKVSGRSNKYTEGPTLAQRTSVVQKQKSDTVSPAVSRTSGQQETNVQNLNESARHQSPDSAEESPISARRILGAQETIRVQPKRSEPNSEELKALKSEVGTVPGSSSNHKDKHSKKCEDCGRCRCPECSRPRMLPSCWTCGRRCVCSAENAVEYGTCVCCIKALFYHCFSDEDDTFADKPFSCSQSKRWVRWSIISVLAFFYPCLCCYLPGRGCVDMCQCCYDRVARPGCRCRDPDQIHYFDDCNPV